MNKIDKWAVVLTAYFFLKSCWKTSYEHYKNALQNETHTVYLVFDEEKFVVAG